MTRLQVLLPLAIFGCLLLWVLAVFDVPRALVFGWIFFLARVLPRMTVDAPSVLVGGVAVCLFAAGVHWIGRTWRRAGSSGAPVVGPWKLRWSLAVVAVVFLLFASGIALVGITHQVGWLLTAREPYFATTVRRYGLTTSTNNLRQVGIGMANYQSVTSRFPPGGTFAPDGEMRHSWETYMLPYMNYYAKIDFEKPWNHPANEHFFKCVIPELINPAIVGPELKDENGFGLSHYAANSQVLAANKGIWLREITDGTSNTLLVGEVNAAFQPWGHPVNYRDPAKGINRSPHGFGGPPSSGGALFVMADGSVRFLSERVSPDVLKALSTPNGGEEVDERVLQPVQ